MAQGRSSEAVVRFYQRIAKTDRIENLEIPHSLVYFTRWLIWEKKGHWFEIDHVQTSMWLEGLIEPDDLKSIPDWYVTKYMGGVRPNMDELRAKVKKLYLDNQKETDVDNPRE